VIVVDASVIIEVLLRTPVASSLEDLIFSDDVTLHAPHLLDLEVAQVMRRYAIAGKVRPRRCREALEDLSNLPMTRYPHTVLLGRVWELRSNMIAYDAAYVALAEAIDGPLLTRDRRLAQSSGHVADIKLV